MQDSAQARRFYIGTYTGENSGRGIYMATLYPDGQVGGLRLVAETPSPSFLALHPTGRFLYAVNEVQSFGGQASGAVTAFEILADGGLRQLNQASSGGQGPCHLALDPGGSLLAVANYGAGSVAVLRVRDDGRLGDQIRVIVHEGSGPNPRRQTRPHAHCVNFDPFRPLLYAADLGIDQVRIYVPDPAGVNLTPADPPALVLPPGAGPRHLDFSPNGRFIYVVNELSSTVSLFSAEPGPEVGPLQSVSTLPADFSGDNTTAEIQTSRDGRTVYASNRGHDSIAVLRSTESDGRLELVQVAPAGGASPRSFSLDPSGRFMVVAAQNSNLLAVLQVSPDTGLLTPTAQTLEVPRPVCVLFAPVRR